MSPQKMFQSCGSSSIAVARINRPMRVTRQSSATACIGPTAPAKPAPATLRPITASRAGTAATSADRTA